MNQSCPRAPFAIILLLIGIGTGAIVFGFCLIDHRQAIPRSGIILAASFGIFFVFYTAALLSYLRWQDKRRAAGGQTTPFKNRHFLPYHDGHTIIFDERPLYLQEETNSEILENFSEYIALIPQ